MADPVVDPITGEVINPQPPASGEGNPPAGPDTPQMATISATEWENIKGRIDAFEKIGDRWADPPTQPATPPTPQGPTTAEQVTEIDGQIGALNTQIDAAVAEQKPVSTLLAQRDELNLKKTRLLVNDDIAPALANGVQTIEQLSDKVTRADMKHLDIVDKDFKDGLASLPLEQRMNPQVRQVLYDRAVGQNIDKILAAREEEILRKASEPPADPPPSNNSRSTGTGADTIPKPEDVYKKESLDAITALGLTVDEYHRKRGYTGWADFWEKTGKEHFGEPA